MRIQRAGVDRRPAPEAGPRACRPQVSISGVNRLGGNEAPLVRLGHGGIDFASEGRLCVEVALDRALSDLACRPV